MKILLDIGHPAHVHYFRNAVRQLENRGHEFLITTRDKEVTLELLRKYNFKFVCTGKNKAGFANKFLTMIRNDVAIFRAALAFKPDLFLSFFSPFAAQVGRFLGKPVIGFTDTEFAKLSIRLTKPFTDHIFTPHCFWTDFGPKQIRFRGYMESFYLHPAYFVPDVQVLEKIGIHRDEPYFVMRFVSFNAGHDAGESGISEKKKIEIAQFLATKGKLIISSEGQLPAALEPYRMRIGAEQFHSLLAFASLYVGEGITTASECAVLGTPAILINTLQTGYIKEQIEHGLVYQFSNSSDALDTIRNMADAGISKELYQERSRKLLSTHIDCTSFLVDIIDRYPQSISHDSIPQNVPLSVNH